MRTLIRLSIPLTINCRNQQTTTSSLTLLTTLDKRHTTLKSKKAADPTTIQATRESGAPTKELQDGLQCVFQLLHALEVKFKQHFKH